QLFAIVIHLVLVLAIHDERNRLGELEDRPAVEGDEGLARELELDRHDAPGRTRAGLAVTSDLADLRVGKDRHVEVDGFLSLMIEPEKWRDLLQRHGRLLQVTGLPTEESNETPTDRH